MDKFNQAMGDYLKSDFATINEMPRNEIERIPEGAIVYVGHFDFCTVVKKDGINHLRSGRYRSVFVEPLWMISVFRKAWIKIT